MARRRVGMGQGKAHWRWQTARQRVQSRRDSSWLWWRVHLPLVRSTLRTLAQARLHQSARSIRGPRAPTYVCTGNRLCFSGVDHVLSRSSSLSHSLSLPFSSSPARTFERSTFSTVGRGLGRGVSLRFVGDRGTEGEKGYKGVKIYS